MALKLNEKYPGYMNAPSVDYPQGSFKNRTSPTSEDGSYFEQDWANDAQGLFQSLIAAASITPNGLVDKVGASQYFDALKVIVRKELATESSAGVAKIATTAAALALVNDTDMLTSKKLADVFGGKSKAFSDNDWTQLPNGLIIQWGKALNYSGAGGVFNYPIAFSSKILCVQALDAGTGAYSIGYSSSLSQLTLYARNPAASGDYVTNVGTTSWMAIGY